MISAGAGVMGSDNSNGSAHKHLAQFTLSNAAHSPALSSCLSVCLLTQLMGALHFIKNKTLMVSSGRVSRHFTDIFHRSLHISITSLFVLHSKMITECLNNFYFIFHDKSFKLVFFSTWPVFHTHVPLPRLLSLFLFIMSLPSSTESSLNRWPVAGCCCARLVGLQEAAYLSEGAQVRACFLMSVSICAHALASAHMHGCVEAHKCICSYLWFSALFCVFLLVCPALTSGNRAGNRRGVQPEQVIKKNPCKMAVVWPSTASSG